MSGNICDWLLGGNRKRRTIVALARPRRKHGWPAAQLSDELGCGVSTAHEILRALRPLGVLEQLPGGGVRLARSAGLANALHAMVKALAPLEGQTVNRPPRGARRS